MADKQSQRAGDNSTQNIIETQVVVEGITEERAVEIAQQQARIAVREKFEAEAMAVASARITRFDQKIIAKLTAQELLDVLGDPSFLSVFQKAQIGAAQTDAESDYELLSGLLVERAKDDARKIRASVSKAVEVIDLIDGEALAALTAFWIVSNVFPTSGMPEEGLDVLDAVYAPYFAGALPSGRGWVEHLDSLNVVRLNNVSGLKSYSDYCTATLVGYVAGGFNREEAEQLDAELHTVFGHKLTGSFLVPHDYRTDYVRLPFTDRESATEKYLAMLSRVCPEGDSEGEQNLRRIVERMGEPSPECVPSFQEAYRRRNSIAAAEAWWDQIGISVSITPIGKALAYVNAKRLHPLHGIDSFEHWVS